MDFLKELTYIKEHKGPYPYLSLHETILNQQKEAEEKLHVVSVLLLCDKIESFLKEKNHLNDLGNYCFWVEPAYQHKGHYKSKLANAVDIHYCDTSGKRVKFWDNIALSKLDDIINDYTNFAVVINESLGTILEEKRNPKANPWFPIKEFRENFLNLFLTKDTLKTLEKNTLELNLPKPLGKSSPLIKI